MNQELPSTLSSIEQKIAVETAIREDGIASVILWRRAADVAKRLSPTIIEVHPSVAQKSPEDAVAAIRKAIGIVERFSPNVPNDVPPQADTPSSPLAILGATRPINALTLLSSKDLPEETDTSVIEEVTAAVADYDRGTSMSRQTPTRKVTTKCHCSRCGGEKDFRSQPCPHCANADLSIVQSARGSSVRVSAAAAHRNSAKPAFPEILPPDVLTKRSLAGDPLYQLNQILSGLVLDKEIVEHRILKIKETIAAWS